MYLTYHRFWSTLSLRNFTSALPGSDASNAAQGNCIVFQERGAGSSSTRSKKHYRKKAIIKAHIFIAETLTYQTLALRAGKLVRLFRRRTLNVHCCTTRLNSRGEQEEGPQMRRVFDFFFGSGRAALWTAVFTGILTIFTWKLYQVSRTTSDTSRASERAFLSFANFALGSRNSNPAGQWISYQVGINWTNSGSTPVTAAVIQANGNIWPTDLPDGFGFPLLPEQTRTVFGPKASSTTSVDVPTIDWTQSWHGAGRLFIWGTAVYRDVFPEDPLRLTEFCDEIHHVTIGPSLTQNPAPPTTTQAPLVIESPNAVVVAFQWQACRQHNCYDNDCGDYRERVAESRNALR